VLGCGLGSFHVLISDGERWRSTGSWVRFNSELLVSKLGGACLVEGAIGQYREG
jgi:hypothetical protein